MSEINAALNGDILTICCKRARMTESDVHEIDITELICNKRYTSCVKSHHEHEYDEILFFQPMKIQLKENAWKTDDEPNLDMDEVGEEEEDSEEILPALFVIRRGGQVLYGYMEQERIYKLLIGMKYKLARISLNKNYLKIGMFAYLTNSSEEQIEKVRFVIDEKNQTDANFKVYRQNIGRLKTLLKGHYYKFKIPVKDLLTDETQINNMLNIVVTVNGVDLEFRIGKKFRKNGNKRKYYAPYTSCYRDGFALHLRRTDRGNFAIVKRVMEPVESTLWFKLMESRIVSYFMYHLGKMVSAHSKKKVSLFYEKFAEKAEEGTFDLFKIAEARGKAKCYYIIDKNSEDYERIKNERNVVKKYSLKYYWLLYRVNSYISTEAPAHLNILRSNNKYFRLATCEHPFVFLQHGITYLKCQGAGSTFAVGKEGEPAYMIVGSEKERDVVSDMLRLKEERLLKTGLPIFSKISYGHINNETPDKVVIMLTWKSYEEHILEFEKSQYYQNVVGIYNMLTKYMDASDIIIVPHPKMLELCENTSLKDTMWTKPISEVLSVAKLLITDYSSVCYNSFYQGGGVIFYQPDLELYQKEVGELIPSDEEYIGKRTFNMDELESEISQVVKNGKIDLAEVRKKEYIERYNTINEFHDGKNIERIAEALEQCEII